MIDDVIYLSASQLQDAFGRRELSPVEVLDAVQARAAQVEPHINALSDRLADSARQAAIESEARFLGRGAAAPRPLEGIPLVFKEEQAIAGLPLRLGSLLTSDEPSTETHPVVERVLGAGAVVHARTTTPEFSCAGFTHSPLWGVTRNPWNLDCTPGGSSGGSGAALAAGIAHLATGSDIGGSIRIPSSLCGVVGFKPPYARVPGLPPFNLDTFCHDGPMARTVADCALLQNVIAGAHRLDPVALPAPAPIHPDAGRVRGMRIAIAPTLGDFPVEPMVAGNLDQVAAALRDAGAQTEQVTVPIERETVMTAALVHFGAIFGPSIAEVGLDNPQLTPYARDFAQRAGAVFDRIGFYGGLERQAAIQITIAEVFEHFDALICPTIGLTFLAADDDYVDHGVTVAGTEMDFYLAAALTPVFNIASAHPVLNVPSGLAENGVPTGVQIVGRQYDDATPFHIGLAVENQLRWWADPRWRPQPING